MGIVGGFGDYGALGGVTLKKLLFFAIITVALGFARPQSPLADTSIELSPSHQAKLFLVGLSFFRNLPADSEGKLNVLLLGGCPVASALGDMNGKALNNYKLNFVDTQERLADADLLKVLARSRIAAVFECATQDSAIRRTALVAGDARTPTLTLSARAVEAGALLGTEVANGRPSLVLNVKTAKDLGLTFDARLTTVARLIQ